MPSSESKRNSRTTVWLAVPDRRLVLTVNDLDEPLPGPVEWGVQRLHRPTSPRLRQTWLGIAAQLDSRSRDGKPE
ncbi:DUF2252 family protein [Nocardia sp. PE-7]|uniref:DUF2252 family protein n=1 Tax=Nocardia sp. PE-7 TaxID=3058426 RepID=UPI0034625E30